MPREQINHPTLELAPDGAHRRRGALHVGWNSQAVQVGIEVDLEYALVAHKLPDCDDPTRTRLWSAELTLEEINQLIATLERAKRKAISIDPHGRGQYHPETGLYDWYED